MHPTLSCSQVASPPLPCCLARQVVDLLCISDAEATRALRFYKWDLTKLQVRQFRCCIHPVMLIAELCAPLLPSMVVPWRQPRAGASVASGMLFC